MPTLAQRGTLHTHTSAEPTDATYEERESDPADQQGTTELCTRQGDAR
jgi:hypothetical protein